MRRAATAVAVLVALVAGCGSDDEEQTGKGEPRLVVSAASSMTEALTACAKNYPGAEPKLQFAG